MSIKLDYDRGFPLVAIAWALALLLLPPIACSGSASPTADGASGEEAESAAAQGDLIGRLPADSTTVGMINFAALRDSAAYKFLRDEGAASGDAAEFEDLIAETGIDPRTDLYRIAFTSSQWFSEGISDASGGVVVATFDRAKMLESIAGQPTEEYGGHTLYSSEGWHRIAEESDHPGDDTNEDDNGLVAEDLQPAIAGFANDSYLTILDDNTVAFGSHRTIRAIVDVANGAASARTNTRLMGLLEDIEPDSETWLVSAQDALFKDIAPNNTVPMQQIPIDRINAIIMSLRLADGIQVNLRGRTGMSSDAELIGDSLNGMLAFGKMMIQGNNPDVFAILDRGITAGSSGRDVTLRANLSIGDLEILSKYARATFEDSMSGEPGE